MQIRGGSETFLAWSQEPLSMGLPCWWVESRGCREVDVIRWVDPLDALDGDSVDAG